MFAIASHLFSRSADPISPPHPFTAVINVTAVTYLSSLAAKRTMTTPMFGWHGRALVEGGNQPVLGPLQTRAARESSGFLKRLEIRSVSSKTAN
jgi:hypothetical protein